MPSRRLPLKTPEGKEVPISVLEIEQREEMLWIASVPVLEDEFPPCVKKMMQKAGGERGSHRIAAILAAFLGQAGWSEPEARRLWSKVANVEDRIFREWFQKMHCPKCETLKRISKGYPDLGIADLDCCRPDEKCSEFQGPIEYAANIKLENDRSKGKLILIKTQYQARVYDWTSGLESKIDLSQAEKEELEIQLNGQTEDKMIFYTRERTRGRLRSRFILKDREDPKRRILSEFL
jgi:hypothetical protein